MLSLGMVYRGVFVCFLGNYGVTTFFSPTEPGKVVAATGSCVLVAAAWIHSQRRSLVLQDTGLVRTAIFCVLERHGVFEFFSLQRSIATMLLVPQHMKVVRNRCLVLLWWKVISSFIAAMRVR